MAGNAAFTSAASIGLSSIKTTASGPKFQNALHGIRFAVPMHFEREYLIFFKEQILSIECLLDEGNVIFAGDTNKNAGTGERGEKLLVKAVNMAVMLETPTDTFDANFTKNSGPQGVVEVGD